MVVGAHRTGQPLNHQLTDLGARCDGVVTTAPTYRLHRLDTVPPKPGLVRVAEGAGAAIEGERWWLSPGALGRFLHTLPAPMALGSVVLDDGSTTVGFTCETAALESAEDITAFGSWPAYLAAGPTPGAT